MIDKEVLDMDISNDFSLTESLKGFIKKLAYDFSVPPEDAMQEARLLEWKLQTTQRSLSHIKTYFKRCIKNKLISYYKGSWSIKSPDRVSFEDAEKGEKDIKVLMKMRQYSQIHYDSLMNHLSLLVAEVDAIALEVLQLRIHEGMCWDKIRDCYPSVSYRRFYNIVEKIQTLTKMVVRGEELAFC